MSKEKTPFESSIWNEAQVEALTKSIQHWLENYEDPQNAEFYSNSCECCKQFPECVDCPVALYAGRIDCGNTPWIRARSALYNFQEPRGVLSSKIIQDTYRAVEDEYCFLLEVMLATEMPNHQDEDEECEE